MTVRAQPRRTLLVDDSVELRQLVRLALERTGRYAVVGEAGDGQEAIASASALGTELDLILLDLSMPRMDGLEALPHLRRIAPEARVVVLSGFATSTTADAARLAGADLYLEKGLPPAVLVAALDGAATTELRPLASAATRPLPRVAPSTDEVVGRLAHDVRTPLLTARSAVSLVREELGQLAPDPRSWWVVRRRRSTASIAPSPRPSTTPGSVPRRWHRAAWTSTRC